MPSAFISHSSPDDRYVQEFVQLVRSLGYDEVFSDELQPERREAVAFHRNSNCTTPI